MAFKMAGFSPFTSDPFAGSKKKKKREVDVTADVEAGEENTPSEKIERDIIPRKTKTTIKKQTPADINVPKDTKKTVKKKRYHIPYGKM